jgi:hypothetical protein
MNLATIRARAYASLMMVGLPSQRFFTPLDSFWPLLDSLVPANVQLVDSGCGMGDLIGEAELHGRGLIGIDVGYREGQDARIQQADAVSYPWDSTTWPMICRPSHDGWAFYTMQKARKAGAAVLYVGLPKNYQRDFGHVRSTCYGIVGEEGERLYVMQPYQRASQ